MKITVSVNDKVSMDVDYSEFADFIGFFNDDPASADFYNELAKHPASQVRAEVASKNCLPIATLEKLAADPSIEVVQRVACNEAALKAFSADTLKAMIRRDVSIALELARFQLSNMKPSVRKIVIAELMQHEDPNVRSALQAEE